MINCDNLVQALFYYFNGEGIHVFINVQTKVRLPLDDLLPNGCSIELQISLPKDETFDRRTILKPILNASKLWERAGQGSK